ncbi:hypothetical protein NECAME_19030 [Necator americanus]|uniref:Uncharacterized protein n=1 Tax=Necator americanus TaxID=51031 RepID=W2SRD9_NECAM|nr:hypothetical protein NECAME_19030 [Necator americanus]ETN72093.1 hypothetical protein NECAME_19030 [Necator americanus]
MSSVGRPEAAKRPDILLSGQAILEHHCDFINDDGSVSLDPQKIFSREGLLVVLYKSRVLCRSRTLRELSCFGVQ